jgi:hypothetical protein
MTSEAQRILRSLLDIAYNRTGLEISKVVTGTAGTADHLSKWNADGDLVDAGDAAAVRLLLGLVIGTNVQGYDADLASWAAITRASGFDTFAATPSSANFAALLSDESGTAGTVPFQSTGTWTPIDSSGAGLIFTSAQCDWTRTGRKVVATIRFSYPSTASGATVLIGGLPFTSQNNGNKVAGILNVPNAGGLFTSVVIANATTFALTNNTTQPTNASFSFAALTGTLTYFI